MSIKNGFDNDLYLKQQTAAILDRVEMFGNKLYLEFGGKLLFDYHAARVLPGFKPNVKMELLQNLKGQADILLCIYAGDIERKKIRADFGITYDADALKLIDDLKEWNIDIRAVVITRYDDQPAAMIFKNKLERRNRDVWIRLYNADSSLGRHHSGWRCNNKRTFALCSGGRCSAECIVDRISWTIHVQRQTIDSRHVSSTRVAGCFCLCPLVAAIAFCHVLYGSSPAVDYESFKCVVADSGIRQFAWAGYEYIQSYSFWLYADRRTVRWWHC